MHKNKGEATDVHAREMAVYGRLREVLNGCAFDNTPVTNLIKNQILLASWNGSLFEKKEPSLKFVLRKYYYLYKKRVNANDTYLDSINKYQDKVLLETTSVEDRCKDLWQPLLNKFGKQNVVLLNTKGLSNLLHDDGIGIIDVQGINYDLREIRKWYKYFARKWAGKVKKLCKELDLPATGYWEIVNIIILSVIDYSRFLNLFKQFRPKAFLAIDDQQLNGASICNILNRRHTPTFTQVHGAIGRGSMSYFAPLNAKYVITWGKYGSSLYVESGTPAENVFACGIQRLQQPEIVAADALQGLREQYNVPVEKPVVLLGFTRLVTESWIEDIKRLHKILPNHYFMCRLHPSTKKESLNIPEDANIRLLESKEIPLKEHIQLSDIVIVDSSTLGFDALFYKKPVIVMDSLPVQSIQGIMKEIIEEGAAKFCKSAEDAKEVLLSAQTLDNLSVARDNFISNYIFAYGDEATDNIYNTVNAKT